MKKLFIFIYLYISIISSSFSQEVNVTSAFDTSRIFIGDQLKFTITVDKPSGLNLTLPTFKDTLCKNIEIISGPVVDSVNNAGRIKIIHKYVVTSFDSGRYQLHPVFAEMKSASGLKRFYSDYSMLEVMRVKITPPDTVAKIYDIIKPYKAPVTFGEVIPWLLLIALIGILGWISFRFIKNLKNKRKGVEIVINPDPAHIIAFRELENLRDQKLWQKGELKHYYTRLTEILRQYLENRFRVYSLELTTVETLDALVKSGFKKNGSYNNLKAILTDADLVKFAKYNPDPSENDVNFQKSWDFILSTKEDQASALAAEEKERSKEESQ